MHQSFLQHAILVDGEANGEFFLEVPYRLVLDDWGLVRVAPTFSGPRGGDVPFDVGGAGDQRYVCQVNDAEGQIELGLDGVEIQSALMRSYIRGPGLRAPLAIAYLPILGDCEGEVVQRLLPQHDPRRERARPMVEEKEELTKGLHGCNVTFQRFRANTLEISVDSIQIRFEN